MKHSTIDKAVDKSLIDPLLEIAASERPNKKLESDHHFKKRLKTQIHHSLDQFKNRIHEGITILMQHFHLKDKERFKSFLELTKHPDKWAEQIQKHEILQNLLSFKNEELTDFYKYGWDCYKHQKYENASNIFLILTLLNPMVGAFWSALGACEETLGHFQDAMRAYLFGAELENETLAPYLHGAKCLLLLNHIDDAKKVLQRAIQRAEEEPKLTAYADKAKEMLNSI